MALKDWEEIGIDEWGSKKRIKESLVSGGSYPEKTLEVSSFHHKHWVVITNLKTNRHYYSKYFKTKSQALKFAKNYMRGN